MIETWEKYYVSLKSKAELQTILGMVTYVSKISPNRAEVTTPL